MRTNLPKALRALLKKHGCRQTADVRSALDDFIDFLEGERASGLGDETDSEDLAVAGGNLDDRISEQSFPCPHCGAPISMLVDLSISDQAQIEDCEVCCRPIAVRWTVDEDGALKDLRVDPATD